MHSGAATERLFFALRPDAAATARIRELTLQLCATHGLKTLPLAIERLHLTLCFLGDHAGLSPQQLAAADEAGRSLRQRPFGVAFDHLASFGRNKGAAPLVLCHAAESAPLHQLHDSLAAHLAQSELFQLDPRPFRPHVTLMYAEKFFDEQPVAPISWTVSEVLLIQSRIGRGHHEVLGRYALCAS